MKTKTTSAVMPGAWVVSPNDKGRKSIKNGKIYLENNQEFEIEVFNPLSECVLADIRVNGQSISETGLIVKPGQRIYLDCFIDDGKKFIFRTYDVESSTEVNNAIKDNGTMEIFFYKEEVVTIKNWPTRYRDVFIKEYYPVYIDRYPYWYGNINTYNTCGSIVDTTTYTTNGSFADYTNCCTSISSNNLVSSNTIDINMENLVNLSTSIDINSGCISFNSNTIETGRVEKGDESNQKFTEMFMDFEKNYIHHIMYQLLPSSRKPAEVEHNKKSSDKLKEGHQAADLIIKLKDLVDCGVITQEEFSEKKKELLSRI